MMLDEGQNKRAHYSLSIAGSGLVMLKHSTTISQVLHLPLLHGFELQQLVLLALGLSKPTLYYL